MLVVRCGVINLSFRQINFLENQTQKFLSDHTFLSHLAVMPLDVQLTEGTQPIPSPLDKCPQEKGLDPTAPQKQQIILNHSTRLHDEHEDVKPKDLEIKTELVDSLLMHKIENEADDDEEDFEEDEEGSEGVEVTKLRSLVEEIGDASVIWKVVR